MCMMPLANIFIYIEEFEIDNVKYATVLLQFDTYFEHFILHA